MCGCNGGAPDAFGEAGVVITCSDTCCKKKYADIGPGSTVATDAPLPDVVTPVRAGESLFTVVRSLDAYFRHTILLVERKVRKPWPLLVLMWYETVLKPAGALTTELLGLTPCSNFAVFSSKLLQLMSVLHTILGPTGFDWTTVPFLTTVAPCVSMDHKLSSGANFGLPLGVKIAECPVAYLLLANQPPMPIAPAAAGAADGAAARAAAAADLLTVSLDVCADTAVPNVVGCQDDTAELMTALATLVLPLEKLLMTGEIISWVTPTLFSQWFAALKVQVATYGSNPAGMVAILSDFFTELAAIIRLYTTMWNQGAFFGYTGKQNARDCIGSASTVTLGAWENNVQALAALLTTLSDEIATLTALKTALLAEPPGLEQDLGIYLEDFLDQWALATYSFSHPHYKSAVLPFIFTQYLSCFCTYYLTAFSPGRIGNPCCTASRAPSCLPHRTFGTLSI